MPLGYTNIGNWSCGNGNAGLSAFGYLFLYINAVHANSVHVQLSNFGAIGLGVTAAQRQHASSLYLQQYERAS
jgi:hypothetical protein